MLQFCPLLSISSEIALMDRFAKLNIGAGKTFRFREAFLRIQQKAVNDGIADAGNEMNEV